LGNLIDRIVFLECSISRFKFAYLDSLHKLHRKSCFMRTVSQFWKSSKSSPNSLLVCRLQAERGNNP
jgi:hypothetical protein